jgi:pyruvate/2-oxoglutarate dehydrogenase complex dihydrolipoamide acyltransferase (E2) component
VTDVHIPKGGMSTVEVEIVEILVEVGEAVEADTAVAVVDGDKAEFEVLAGAAGTVHEVLVADGDECNVGDVIMRLA